MNGMIKGYTPAETKAMLYQMTFSPPAILPHSAIGYVMTQ